MKRMSAVILIMLTLCVGSGLLAAPVVTEEKVMQVGQTLTLDFQGLSRAAISDPKVVDVAVLSTTQLLLNAKSPGSATLDAWDKRGQSRLVLTVNKPGLSMAEMVTAINKELATTGIAARELNGTVLLEGQVTDPAVSKRAELIAASYVPEVRNLVVVASDKVPQAQDIAEVIRQAMAPTELQITGKDKLLVLQGTVSPADAEKLSRILSGISRIQVVSGSSGGSSSFAATTAGFSSEDAVTVINLVTTTAYTPRQLLVKARVIDVDKAALDQLGVEWGSQRVDEKGNVIVEQPIIFGEARLLPLPVNEGGPFRRLDLLGASLTALITNNKARILSEPNLLVMEGQRGNIHLGGEIPVPVVQGITPGQAPVVTIQWKRFGVDLDIEGRIGPDGKTVDLRVSPEVSELDYGNAVVASGISIPALRNRSATTQVSLTAGQTLVIGGLLQNEDTKVVRRIPLLSEIPIIGEFFKRTDKRHNARELIIFVTPEIVTAPQLAERSAADLVRLTPPAPPAPTAMAQGPESAACTKEGEGDGFEARRKF